MKRLFFILLITSSCVSFKDAPVFTSTGDVLTTSGTNVSRGFDAWVNPGNITADDGTNSSCNSFPSGQSDYLVAKGFGFSVPSDAIVLGVTVKVEMAETRVGFGVDFRAQLQDDAGTLAGSGKVILAAENGGTPTVYTYGSTSDIWGATLTPAIVNDADFGVRFWFTHIADAVFVDYVTIAVEYRNRRGVIIN